MALLGGNTAYHLAQHERAQHTQSREMQRQHSKPIHQLVDLTIPMSSYVYTTARSHQALATNQETEMLKNSLACTLLVCLGVVMQGCGAAEVGEACATRGEQEECVENAICDSTSDSAEPICLKVCTDDAQCASTEACNGVSGSNIKACKPKTK